MLKPKLQYFGHLMRRTDSLEKTLMLGKIEGRRRRGWDGWMASLTQWMWVWANSGARDGQGGLACCSPWGCRVGHDWATSLSLSLRTTMAGSYSRFMFNFVRSCQIVFQVIVPFCIPISNVCEFEWTPGVGDGQGGLACCSPWGCRVGHDWATELNWTPVYGSSSSSSFPLLHLSMASLLAFKLCTFSSCDLRIHWTKLYFPKELWQAVHHFF